MMQRALPFVALLPLTLLMGCAYALPLATRPADVKLRVHASHPERYVVRVTAFDPPSDYQILSDGRISFTVPSFRRGCSVYIFDVIKVADGRPERLRVIEVRRDRQVIRRFSLTQLADLPEDEEGYKVIKLQE